MGSSSYLSMSLCSLCFFLVQCSNLIKVINSSSSMQPLLCNEEERTALLLFKQSFSIEKFASDDKEKRPKFCINDHLDILSEILKRLDGRSSAPPPASAACGAPLPATTGSGSTSASATCLRRLPDSGRWLPPRAGTRGSPRCVYVPFSPASRMKKLRLGGGGGGGEWEVVGRVWARDEVELSPSLFCIDYYERLGGGGGRHGGDSSASSLMFLCKPVNV
ncbi:F-box protein SNE [Camellia lanceoleosa]|uniref:F-box protein SNE n=1 Tax=Camellia lanceoleosa TaxID=1840588 RepID=A0ACC0H3R5_9ERIC|nr:F-box protein SNE [Camellia lanceoleosa]